MAVDSTPRQHAAGVQPGCQFMRRTPRTRTQLENRDSLVSLESEVLPRLRLCRGAGAVVRIRHILFRAFTKVAFRGILSNVESRPLSVSFDLSNPTSANRNSKGNYTRKKVYYTARVMILTAATKWARATCDVRLALLCTQSSCARAFFSETSKTVELSDQLTVLVRGRYTSKQQRDWAEAQMLSRSMP